MFRIFAGEARLPTISLVGNAETPSADAPLPRSILVSRVLAGVGRGASVPSHG